MQTTSSVAQALSTGQHRPKKRKSKSISTTPVPLKTAGTKRIQMPLGSYLDAAEQAVSDPD